MDTPPTVGSIVEVTVIEGAEATGVVPLGAAGVFGASESSAIVRGGDGADGLPAASTATTVYA